MQYQIHENKLILPPQKALEPLTIKNLLDKFFLGKSQQHLYRQEDRILLSGKACQYQEEIIGQQEVTILFPVQEVDWMPSEEEAQVVYESPFALVVHKPAGMIIHSSPKDSHCLNAQVARYYLNHHLKIFVRPIHRLDKDTSGLVFYSKIPFFQSYFDNALQRREIKRNYYAICLGDSPIQETYRFKDPIGRDRHKAGLYRVSPSGKEAETLVHYLRPYKEFHLFDCELMTGRTHQIRVHLSFHHYPIVNDMDYGLFRKNLSTMGLFAYQLKFKDPISHKSHRIEDHWIVENIEKNRY